MKIRAIFTALVLIISNNAIAATAAKKQLDLNKAVDIVSKTVKMWPSMKRIETRSDNSSYSVTLYYDANVPVQADTYVFATEFVRYLVSIGRDPSDEANKRSVHVCAMQDGLTTVTGKPGVIILGCSHYNPYKDVVTWDGA